jgi:phage shock protein PspC (stress-responsive transcriptional regulator)
VIFAGCGLLAYVIAWIVVPEEPMAMAVPQAPATGTQQSA